MRAILLPVLMLFSKAGLESSSSPVPASITFDPTETKMVGKVEEEEVARCQVVSTADINTREEALLPATKSFSMISKPS